jgi:predicted transcriptional regulator of viral defense system
MAQRKRLIQAKGKIAAFFEAQAQHVFTNAALSQVFKQNRELWRLPQRVSATSFVSGLVDEGLLNPIQLQSLTYRGLIRYAWKKPSPFEIGLSIKRKSYLSHGTAAFLNNLSQTVPHTIYVNAEQTEKPAPPSPPTQESIDRAFSRPQRSSKYIFTFEQYSFVILAGKFTNGLKVSAIPGPEGEPLRVTVPERTLIDIVVRPAYAGGVYDVLTAFRAARSTISVNTLVQTLRQLNYAYPYQQAIGFYMERAGYSIQQLDRLRELGTPFNFFLAHDLREVEFDSNWRLFYPKGI